jgi:hypothetical protein
MSATTAEAGRFAAGAAPVEHHIAHGIAVHQHAVEHIVHAGQRMRLRQERRMHAQFDLPVFILASQRDQFNDVAEFSRVFDVARADAANALRDKSLQWDGDAKALLARICSLYMVSKPSTSDVGSAFGVAKFLRFGEDFIEVAAFARHLGQDVVGRAVENAHQLRDAVGDQLSRSGDTSGIPPPTLPSKRKSTPARAAARTISGPCLAMSSLLAVTTDLPL